MPVSVCNVPGRKGRYRPKGWRHARRFGRHTIDSNAFRFLRAPCGGRVEHVVDFDRVNEPYGTCVHETSPPHFIRVLCTNRYQESPAS